MYHRIGEPASDPSRLAVSAENFAEHVALLRDRFRPLPMRELVRGLSRRSVPGRAVVVTFDDGYRDNLHIAKPVLARHEVPASVFIVTEYVDSGTDFWWDQLEDIFRTTGASEYRYKGNAWQRLRLLPHGERLAALEAIRRREGLQRADAELVLTPDEVRLLADGGLIEIGAHTATHPLLSSLPPAEQLFELRSNKARLEEIVGVRVDSLSYPHGDYDRATMTCAQEVGFTHACAGHVAAVSPRTPLLAIPRLHVGNVSVGDFEQLLDQWLLPV